LALAEGRTRACETDDGQLFHIPGSTKSYTDTEINRSTSTVDWFPELHPAPPASVISGKQGAYNACGQCHLIDGRGKPDTADLRGLPVAYFLQQLADMKDGKRRGSVSHATVNDMIPVAKAIDAQDAKLAAEYFHSVPAVRGARVIETDTVPVTHPGPHNVQLVDATEPKNDRDAHHRGAEDVNRRCCAMPRPGSSHTCQTEASRGARCWRRPAIPAAPFRAPRVMERGLKGIGDISRPWRDALLLLPPATV